MNLVLHLSSTSYIPLIFSLTYLTFLHVIYLPVYIYICFYYFTFIRVSHYSITLQYTICMYNVVLRFFLTKNGMYICIIFFLNIYDISR